jgi:pyruvate kinase
MVSLPTEAAGDYLLIKHMLDEGMDCVRINCAHDDPPAWERMIGNLRRAECETGKRCKILMDLAGPKLRTGPLTPGPKVVKWRPQRDAFGNVISEARILLQPEGLAPTSTYDIDVVLQVSREWLDLLRSDDTVEYVDARGAHREMRAIERHNNGWLCRGALTSYVTEKTALWIRRKRQEEQDPRLSTTVRLDESTAVTEPLLLHRGDILRLDSDHSSGGPPVVDASGAVVSPAHIACTLPEVFAGVRIGDQVWFDDGKIGGKIRTNTGVYLEVEITHARPKGERLRAEKGINFPDSRMRIASLTAKDIEDLSFVVKHADIVGLSFVQHVSDLHKLQEHLSAMGGEHLGILLKVETRRGFELLPDLILAAMRSPSLGVMIARGDLAVECGYQRLAEVQEEILWICEAAHVPVVWATQVLESLAKDGIPSRAEITDAAMGQRAECVMLNKGPHVEDAIRILDDILRRMQEHQRKKRPMLRRLRWWRNPESHLRQLKPGS